VVSNRFCLVFHQQPDGQSVFGAHEHGDIFEMLLIVCEFITCFGLGPPSPANHDHLHQVTTTIPFAVLELIAE